MYNNTVLKDKGMRILAEQLGLVEAERFIVLMRREPFDSCRIILQRPQQEGANLAPPCAF